MAKWIHCKKCGHKYMNSIKRCPQCFAKAPINARAFLATIPIILVILAAVILPIIALNGKQPEPVNGGTTTAPVITAMQTGSTVSETTTSASAVTTAKSSGTSAKTTGITTAKYRQPTDNDDNVVIGNDGIAKITMPKWLLLLVDPAFDYTLTDKEKTEYRFTAISKNADGSATYTIDQNDFHRCRLILASNTNGLITDLNDHDTVTRVSYTYGQYGKIKLYTTHTSADAVLSDSELAQSVAAAGLSAMVVQHFDIDQPVSSVFEIYGADSSLLATSTYPDALLK